MACGDRLLHYKCKNTRVVDGTASLTGDGLQELWLCTVHID